MISLKKKILKSIHIVSILWLLFFLFANPKSIYSKDKNSIKAAFEYGVSDVQLYGKGTLQRAMFKVNSFKEFKPSYLLFKLNSNLEYFNVERDLTGAKILAQLDYIYSLDNNKQLNLTLISNNKHMGISENYNQQIFQTTFQSAYLHTISKNLSYQISGQNSHYQLYFNSSNYKRICRLSSDIILHKNQLPKITLGAFVTDIFFNKSYDNFNWASHGFKIDLGIKNKSIFGLSLQVLKYSGHESYSKKITLLYGNYFKNGISLFSMLNVFYSESIKNSEYQLVSNQEENFNSFSLKIGYDLSNSFLLYLKTLYDEQNLLGYRKMIKMRQLTIGTQYTF